MSFVNSRAQEARTGNVLGIQEKMADRLRASNPKEKEARKTREHKKA